MNINNSNEEGLYNIFINLQEDSTDLDTNENLLSSTSESTNNKCLVEIGPDAKLLPIDNISFSKKKKKKKNKSNLKSEYMFNEFPDETFDDDYSESNPFEYETTSKILPIFFNKMNKDTKEQYFNINNDQTNYLCHQQSNHFDKYSDTPPRAPHETKKPSAWGLAKNFIATYHAVNVSGQIYAYINELYEAVDIKKIKGLMMDLVSESTRHKLNDSDYVNAYNQLSSYQQIVIEEKPENKFLIDCENGLFHLKDRKFIARSPEHFVTFRFKAMLTSNTSTPVFDEFIQKTAQGDKEIERRILQFMSYCIIPGNYGKYFFVLGTASNSGKSILAKFLEELFGRKFVSHVPIHDFGKNFDMAPLKNRFLNTSMDLTAGKISENAISLLKNLTGGDPIELKEKYVPNFEYLNEAKFVFGSNHAIAINQQDDAFWERLVFVPFIYSVPKSQQDHELLDKLRAEKNAIFSKLVKIATKIIKQNYMFSQCSVADAIVYQWHFGTDSSVFSFVEHCCEITHNSKVLTHTSKLYSAYINFCEYYNYDAVTINQFSRILKNTYQLKGDRKVGEPGGSSLRGFEGIILLTEN